MRHTLFFAAGQGRSFPARWPASPRHDAESSFQRSSAVSLIANFTMRYMAAVDAGMFYTLLSAGRHNYFSRYFRRDAGGSRRSAELVPLGRGSMEYYEDGWR